MNIRLCHYLLVIIIALAELFVKYNRIIFLIHHTLKRNAWGQYEYFQGHLNSDLIGGFIIYYHKNYGAQAGGATRLF